MDLANDLEDDKTNKMTCTQRSLRLAFKTAMPGTVAWSDACLHGMRMVEGSILTSSNFLSWRLVMK